MKEQIQKHRFYKTKQGSWFIDLPDWRGAPGELQMVAGADTLLDKLSEGKGEVFLEVSLSPQPNFETLQRIETKEWGGADYKLETYKNKPVNKEIWLCDVAKYVFDDFPTFIYFKKLSVNRVGKTNRNMQNVFILTVFPAFFLIILNS